MSTLGGKGLNTFVIHVFNIGYWMLNVNISIHYQIKKKSIICHFVLKNWANFFIDNQAKFSFNGYFSLASRSLQAPPSLKKQFLLYLFWRGDLIRLISTAYHTAEFQDCIMKALICYLGHIKSSTEHNFHNIPLNSNV